jgi:hypothetical protein
MHPAILRELAAEHVKSLTAVAEDIRPAGLAQAPAEPDLVPAASFAGLSGDPLPERLADADQRDLACQQIS